MLVLVGGRGWGGWFLSRSLRKERERKRDVVVFVGESGVGEVTDSMGLLR